MYRYLKNIFLTFCLFASSFVWAKEPIKTLVVTGQNNHNWRASTNILVKYLNNSELFKADVAISPAKGENMDLFEPDFSAYSLVVLDYNGESWSAKTQTAFLDFVKNGGGVVVYHAANNAFPEWKEFNEIIGLGGWGNRTEKDGTYVYFKDGKVVRDDSPGSGGSHGAQHEYDVVTREKDHPIMKGLPEVWTHDRDELYDKLRGPALNMTILATAFSSKEKGGTNRDEPALMVINWGKGRIFHTILGHVGNDAKHPAIDCPGFIVTFLRGSEWAATGKVTQKVPDSIMKKAKVKK